MFRICLFILAGLALALAGLTGSITAAGMATVAFLWAVKIGV